MSRSHIRSMVEVVEIWLWSSCQFPECTPGITLLWCFVIILFLLFRTGHRRSSHWHRGHAWVHESVVGSSPLPRLLPRHNQCCRNLSYQIRLKLAKIIIKSINGIDQNSRDECPAELVTLELKIGLAGYDSAGSARMGIALWWAKNGIPYRVKGCKEGNRCGQKSSKAQNNSGAPPACPHCNGNE